MFQFWVQILWDRKLETWPGFLCCHLETEFLLLQKTSLLIKELAGHHNLLTSTYKLTITLLVSRSFQSHKTLAWFSSFVGVMVEAHLVGESLSIQDHDLSTLGIIAVVRNRHHWLFGHVYFCSAIYSTLCDTPVVCVWYFVLKLRNML